jgi:hypothetical protein
MGRRYIRGFNAVAKEELWNRWRHRVAWQLNERPRDFGLRNPNQTRFNASVASTD